MKLAQPFVLLLSILFGGYIMFALCQPRSGFTEEQLKRIKATKAREDALRASMPGWESDDDEDAIWRHGRHVNVKLPYVGDLPELPPSVQSEAPDKEHMLGAEDFLQVVAHWLCSHYGSVVWDIHVDETPTSMEQTGIMTSQAVGVSFPSMDGSPLR